MKNSKRIKMVLLVAVVSVGVLTGCAGKEGESPATESIVTQSPATEAPEATKEPEVTEAPKATEAQKVTEEPQITEAPKVTEEPDTTDLSHWNYADYVTLGNYKDIETVYDGLDTYVGDISVDLPYYDETGMTLRTLQYFYSQKGIEVDIMDLDPLVYIEDEEIVKLGIPGVTGFWELKDYVIDKVNENEGVISMMLIGDAFMETLVKRSEYEKLPEQVIADCEKIYTDYVSEMEAGCNDIGDMPDEYIEETKNVAQKVLAAMAIAKEEGLDEEGFSYSKVMKYIYINY